MKTKIQYMVYKTYVGNPEKENSLCLYLIIITDVSHDVGVVKINLPRLRHKLIYHSIW